MIRTEYLTVTPQMAINFLECNTNNRNLRQKVVKELSDLIKRGEWITTHQGICITESGVVADGQHRLSAIVLSNTPVTMAVTFGASDNSFKVIDCGLNRSISDRTKINQRTAEVLRTINSDILSNRTKITSAQTLNLYEVFGDRIEELAEFCGTKRKYISSAPMRTSAVLCSYIDKEYAFNTYRDLVTGEVSFLSNLAKWYVKLTLTGRIKVTGGEGARESLVLGMNVFDVMKSQLSRLHMNENSFSEAIEKSTKIINSQIKGE